MMKTKILVFLMVCGFFQPLWAASIQKPTSAKIPNLFQKQSSGKVLLKQKPYWEQKEDEILAKYDSLWGLGTMSKFKKNVKNDTCNIDLVSERLLQNYGNALLSNDYPTAIAYLLRFTNYLKCISPQTAFWVDYAGSEIFMAVENHMAGREDGIKALMNPFLLSADLVFFRHSYVQYQIQSHRALIKAAVADYPVEMGLHCLDLPTGSLVQYTQKCSDSQCVQAMPEMVTTVSNENGRMGLGLCGCSDIVGQNFICGNNLPACMAQSGLGMDKGSQLFGKGAQKVVDGLPSKNLKGAGGADKQGGKRQAIPYGNVGSTAYFNAQMGNISSDNVPLWMQQFSESQLQTMACTGQGISNMIGDAMGGAGMSPNSGCSTKTLIGFAKSMRQTPSIGDQARCVMTINRAERERAFNVALNPAWIANDSNCQLADMDPLTKLQWNMRVDHFGQRTDPNDPLRGTLATGADAIRNDPNAVNFIQQNCPTTCTNIEQRMNQTLNQAQQDPRTLAPVGPGHPEGGMTITAIGPDGRAVDQRVGIASNRTSDVDTAIHELWHAILNAFGIRTDNPGSGAHGQAPPDSQEALVQKATDQTKDATTTDPKPKKDEPPSTPATGGTKNPGEGGGDCSAMSQYMQGMAQCIGLDKMDSQKGGPMPGRTPGGVDPTIAYPSEDSAGTGLDLPSCLAGPAPPPHTNKAGPDCNFGDVDCNNTNNGGAMIQSMPGLNPQWTDPNPDAPAGGCPAGEEPWFGANGRIECRPVPPSGGGGAGPD